MGSCASQTRDDPHSALISHELSEDKQIDSKVTKILFLGSGGSGKSTIFKQLRGIYGEGFNRTERQLFVSQIHEQVITQMKLALEMLEEYRNENGNSELLHENENKYIDKETKQNENEDDTTNKIPQLSEFGKEAQKYLDSVHYTSYKLTDEIVSALKCLWSEPAIQKIYEMRNITKISDSSAYFWDKLDQINSEKYVPDQADILLVRNRSTGVTEERYNSLSGRPFCIIDVGGQKSERKKWINCFDGVTAVIFVADLSCYNEVLYEDYYTNAMTDQLDLFDDICNCQSLKFVSMILFLNKKDIFEDKIKRVALSKCDSFKDYTGREDSYDETVKYISSKFNKLNSNPEEKYIFTHVTCATDYDNIQKVFVDVEHIVVDKGLNAAGF